LVVLNNNEVEILKRQIKSSNSINDSNYVYERPMVELNEREGLILRIFIFLCSTGLRYKEFFEVNENLDFPKISIISFNREIKQVLKKLNFNNYELISSHTGRRTYLSLNNIK
jgi:hypothetical protein